MRTTLRRTSLVVGLALFLCLSLFAETATVTQVVDGDTIKVDINGRIETVRLIGVDTPETVHPNKPVERFGKEASNFTRSTLTGKTVRLEVDPTGDTRDKYGRILRHVYLDNGTLFNALLIQEGYAHAYTRFPFSKMEEFRELERQASEAGKGLWAKESYDNVFKSVPESTTVAYHLQAKTKEAASQTVYITKTGKKYHRAGCRYLSRSQIPIDLSTAAASYGPCSVCAPPIPGTATAAKPASPSYSAPNEAKSSSGSQYSGRCQATTKKGTQCKRSASAGSNYCWQHGK